MFQAWLDASRQPAEREATGAAMPWNEFATGIAPFPKTKSKAPMTKSRLAPKILFLVTEDWYFWSHRARLARAAHQAGAEVIVMTRVNQFRAAMEKEGFRIIPWRISRGSLNPLRELYAFFQVVRAYRRERPDLLHHVALKPILHGGFAARLCGRIPSLNAIAGLGHVFISSRWKMRILRPILCRLLRGALQPANCKTVFQNDDNRNLLVRKDVVSAQQAAVIRGVGVDTERFSPRLEPAGIPVVMLASRLLWEKGVGEFITAARELREQGVKARFVLVGKPDPENSSSIPNDQLRRWEACGWVEWWGHQSEMATTLAQATIVCLPSYLEGLPNVLVEAAACGRPIVTTDVPGCREVVKHEENGLLVPPRDSEALAAALATLINNPSLRARMGARGREIVDREFAAEHVLAQTLKMYRELLRSRWSGAHPLTYGRNEIASEHSG